MKVRVDSVEKDRLDGFVVNAEFLLISVIQGGALAAIAVAAAFPFSSFDFALYPYIFSALILILVFWAQAIVHTISFIEWPLDIIHNMLYFIIGFIEIMAFSSLASPLHWFFFILLFFIIAGVLYFYDLKLIKGQRNNFQESEARRKLYQDILKRQKFELYTFVPGVVIYNILCLWLIYTFPNIFITQGYHVVLGLIFLGFGLVVMLEAFSGFKKRIRLVSKTIESERG